MGTLFTILGWAGALLVVSAYGLSSFKKIESNSIVFHVMNLLGAILLAASSLYSETYQFTFINSVWSVIAIVSLWKIIARRRST